MVEGLRIEADENGWELVIEGDLVEECEAYLAGEGLTLRLNIQSVALAFAMSRGFAELLDYRTEAWDAAVSRPRRDDGDGYALDDPKHPTYHERMSEAAARRRSERLYDPVVDHPERYHGNNPWRPI